MPQCLACRDRAMAPSDNSVPSLGTVSEGCNNGNRRNSRSSVAPHAAPTPHDGRQGFLGAGCEGVAVCVVAHGLRQEAQGQLHVQRRHVMFQACCRNDSCTCRSSTAAGRDQGVLADTHTGKPCVKTNSLESCCCDAKPLAGRHLLIRSQLARRTNRDPCMCTRPHAPRPAGR